MMEIMEKMKYVVSVNCWTYNHSAWIKDAMNGFCQQETTFPFVCVIVDDYSTDGEQDIIKKYLQKNFDIPFYEQKETQDYRFLFAQHKTNKNCFFAVYLLKYNYYAIKKSKKPYLDRWISNSEYVAICEGDDYWIDSEKLQIQVDFMQTHPDHTMCIHAYRADLYKGSYISSSKVHKYPYDVEIIPDKDVINGTGMFGATASIVYRALATKDYPEWALRAPVGDRPLKYVLFARGHIGYIDKVMSVYRIGISGSWTARMQQNKNYRKETHRKMSQLNSDFDKWTEGKYHNLIMKAEREYKRMLFLNIIKQPLKDVYRWMKGLFKYRKLLFVGVI